MNARCLVLLLTALVNCCRDLSAEDYERHIRNFATNTPVEIVEASITAIIEAGTNAFPALLAHLQDSTPAVASCFQREAITRLPDGTWGLVVPTIGNACFDLLQSQIEGNWPKAFRIYYVLRPESASDWLSRHAGLPLQQLRVEAAKESLKNAEADTKRRGKKGSEKQLSFFRENLERAILNAKASKQDTNLPPVQASPSGQRTR